jgi:hypothetical protein
VDGDDVRVVERRRRAGFRQEATTAIGVGQGVARQDLDRDVRFSRVSTAR